MDNRTPYKTAAELGIEQWEHDGLVALVGPLSRCELPFNYGEYAEGVEAVCIGCHVARKRDTERTAEKYVERKESGVLGELYWSEHRPDRPQAARGIVNFLVTGDPQWDAVMSGSAA